MPGAWRRRRNSGDVGGSSIGIMLQQKGEENGGQSSVMARSIMEGGVTSNVNRQLIASWYGVAAANRSAA